MVKETFTVRKRNIGDYATQFPNLKSQLQKANSILKYPNIERACVFLKTDNGYIPAFVSLMSDKYIIQPVVTFHAVGERTGDSYSDLLKILNEGFSSDGLAPNSVVREYDETAISYQSVYDRPSKQGFSQGDVPYIEIEEIALTEGESIPEPLSVLESGWFHSAIKRAETNATTVVIRMSKDSDAITKSAKKTEYEKVLRNYNHRIV